MDPITDQDLPQDGIIFNEDGSVDIEDEDTGSVSSGEFLENLVSVVPETELNGVVRDLLEAIERDRKARERRDKQYEDGLRRTGLGDDAPGGAEFEGASRVVHPVLAEACVEFESRAIKELFPPQGPVKTATIGVIDEAQLDRAERKRTFMNWQLTTQMQEYRSELEQLLTQLPLGGSQFQKFWYDTRFSRPTSEFVPIDDILIPYAATSFYTAERVTHVQHITQQEFEKRVDIGLYEDIDVSSINASTPEPTATSVANDKIEGKEEDAYNEDGLRDVYEIYTWLAFDADGVTNGELAPYIITIDEHSEKAVALYRNWSEADERFEKLDWFVEWKFVPWRGAYAIGFPQLIGSLSAAATGALRALLDSAHINNTPALVKLHGGQVSGQNISVEVTGITDIKAPAGVDDIRKLLMPMPYNQPSPILFQLLGWLTTAAKDVVRTADSAIQNAGDRTPVGTTQAMIEQGSMIYSAIHARLHESQKRALQILHRINKTWLSEEEQIEDLGKLVIRRDDFEGSLDVIPVSDPAIFSEAQRFAQNQSLQQMQAQDAQDPTIPWNKLAIRRRVLKQMRIDNIDELLPLAPKPVTSDPLSEAIAAMQGMQLKAAPNQDHMAHISAHVFYLANPTVVQNPLVPGLPLMALLGHVQQHIMLLQQQIVANTAAKVAAESGMTSQDQLMATAIRAAAPEITRVITPVLEFVGELQKQIQAKMPTPQLPPEVQASIQIAQMDINRKAQMDKATLELKNAEQQARQAMEQQQLALDSMQQRFEQAIETQRLGLEAQNSKLTAQVDLMNNRHDNEQKQLTELLKNRDDNFTKLEIALQNGLKEVQQSVTQAPQQSSTPQVDLSPYVEKMQGLLDQINQSKTNDALTTVVQGLQQTIQTLSQPRRTVLETDKQGRAIGAISTLSE